MRPAAFVRRDEQPFDRDTHIESFREQIAHFLMFLWNMFVMHTPCEEYASPVFPPLQLCRPSVPDVFQSCRYTILHAEEKLITEYQQGTVTRVAFAWMIEKLQEEEQRIITEKHRPTILIADVEQRLLLIFDEAHRRFSLAGRQSPPRLYPQFLLCLRECIEEGAKQTPDPTVLETLYQQVPQTLRFLLIEMILETPDCEDTEKEYAQLKEIGAWIYDFWQLHLNQPTLEERLTLLWKLFQGLRDLNCYEIIPQKNMGRIEGKIRQLQEQQAKPVQPVGVRLHEKLLETGALDQLEEPRRRLLDTFLLTEKSMGDIAKEKMEGIGSVPGISKNLLTSLDPMFSLLSPQDQQTFGGSAKHALQTVATDEIKAAARSKKISEGARRGWSIDKPRQTGKANRGRKNQFTQPHKDALSAGASRRWERFRAERATQPVEHNEHIAVANTIFQSESGTRLTTGRKRSRQPNKPAPYT